MKKMFTVRINNKINKIIDETYETMLAAAKHKNPKAEELIDDPEISKLHDIIPLLRLGHIKVFHDESLENLCLQIIED